MTVLRKARLAEVLLVVLLVCTLPRLVLATTWSEQEVDDPFSDAVCTVSSPASYGSYVYHWPSKFDGVYWPHTTMRWVWHCPESGYTSFGDDFEGLNDAEKQRIGAFLQSVPMSAFPTGDAAKLVLLEAIYKLRDKDDEFWGWFLRVKANLYESLADASRYESIKYMEKTVESDKSDFNKLQTTFVLGRYLMKYGDDNRAKALFDRARSMPWVDEEGNAHVGSDYINRLIEETEDSRP